MSKRLYLYLMSGAALSCAVLSAAPALAAPGEAGTLEEVVVTARRASERLQDVPVSVQAISGDQIEKLAITQFTEVNKLSPGLQLSFASGTRGSNAEVTLRGVRWSSASGSVAIPIYINEVQVDPNYALLSLYDIGQLEVLRGPQGVTRGAPSFSGAITLRPKTPDLASFGGYVGVQVGTHGHTNFQGAVNVPIIPDKLAIRFAGLDESSEGNRVRSLNNPLAPEVETKSARISLAYRPTDSLSVDLGYQYVTNANRTYDQVSGTGSLGFTTPAGAAPGQVARVLAPNWNGPPISTEDYLGLNNARSDISAQASLWTLNVKWDVAGHTLQYIGGFQRTANGGVNSQDAGNVLVGFDPLQVTSTAVKVATQEFRLSSNPGDHMVDYVVGAYLYHSYGQTNLGTTSSYLPGALGLPGATASPFVNPTAALLYRLPQNVYIPISQVTTSFYGGLTFHLPWDIELSGQVRKLYDHRRANSLIVVGPGTGVVAAGAGGVCAAGSSVSTVYGPGYCDRVLVAQLAPLTFPSDQMRRPTVFNVSLSHKFTPDILGYATVGSSYRTPGSNIGLFVASEAIRFPQPERATSYETGLKTTWLQNRLRLNVDIFQIDYDGQLAQFPGINYRNVTNGTIAVTSTAFYQNTNSRVRGVEVEAAFQPMRNLTLSGNLSYAKITSKAGLVPCNNPAVPLTATNEINFCPQPAGVTLNTAPPFTAALNGEYVIPVDKYEGYLRFNLAYSGDNPNYGYLAEVPSYTLLDLFAGVRDPDRGWEAGVYAKNALDKKVELSRTVITSNLAPASGTTASQFGQPGYSFVTSTVPLEVGLQLRYAFGSR
jgi:iron complex outermembrane receptor protein